MENGIPFSVYVLSFGVFIIMVGFGFMMPFFPLFAEDIGATTIDIGLLVSVFMITRAALAPYFGKISDRSGKRKNILLIGSFLYAVLMLSFAFAQNVLELYVIRSLQGVASAAYWPVAESLIADITPMQYRGRAMGIYLTSNNMAFFAGPGLAGFIYVIFNKMYGFTEVESFRYAFVIGGILAFVSTTIIALGVKEPSVEKKREVELINRNFIKESGFSDINDIYDVSLALLSFYIIALANGFAMGMSMPIFVLYMNDYLNAPPEFISFILSLTGLANLLSAYPAGWMSDIFGRRGVIIVGMLFSRISSILLVFATNLYYFAGLAVTRSFFFNVASPSFRALQADIVSFKSRGKVFGTVQAFFNIGAVFGPIIGTYIYHLYFDVVFELHFPQLTFIIYGPAINFLISGVIGLFSLSIFIRFVRPLKIHSDELKSVNVE